MKYTNSLRTRYNLDIDGSNATHQKLKLSLIENLNIYIYIFTCVVDQPVIFKARDHHSELRFIATVTTGGRVKFVPAV